MALRFDATKLLLSAKEKAAAILLQAGNDVLDISQQFVPVDKGDLKKSGKVEQITPEQVVIGYGGPDLVYAKYQEFGTSNMAAQPYLTPAMAEAESIIRARAEKLRELE